MSGTELAYGATRAYSHPLVCLRAHGAPHSTKHAYGPTLSAYACPTRRPVLSSIRYWPTDFACFGTDLAMRLRYLPTLVLREVRY
eukprot:1612930-Rhodomonas_salina.9